MCVKLSRSGRVRCCKAAGEGGRRARFTGYTHEQAIPDRAADAGGVKGMMGVLYMCLCVVVCNVACACCMYVYLCVCMCVCLCVCVCMCVCLWLCVCARGKPLCIARDPCAALDIAFKGHNHRVFCVLLCCDAFVEPPFPVHLVSQFQLG
jgi:hypothetical protein